MSENLHPKRTANPGAQRPKVKNRDIDNLIAAAWEQGWWCELTKKNHVMGYAPNGTGIVTFPGTPSDHRAVRNARSLLRQHGVNLK